MRAVDTLEQMIALAERRQADRRAHAAALAELIDAHEARLGNLRAALAAEQDQDVAAGAATGRLRSV